MRLRTLAITLAVLACLGALVAGTAVSAQSDPTVRAAAADPTRLPLGDGKRSRSAQRGSIFACQQTFRVPTGRVARDHPWIRDDGTWDSTAKAIVAGDVPWPQARYQARARKGVRRITSNNLPVRRSTGVFPVRTSDPAYAYTRNANRIQRKEISLSLKRRPRLADDPKCLNTGPIGILRDGVLLFSALDPYGRDAGAREVFDRCGGHPEGRGAYHRHLVPACVAGSSASARSTLVGYAFDGLGIYVERDASGQLLTNDALDACHGRRSRVRWNGRNRRVYHYVATLEYPYTLGCYRGKPRKTDVVLAGVGSGGARPR